MLYIEDEKVLGYQRLLPTTRPHLLSEVMSQLCDGKRPVGIHIWEWTRLCVAASHRTGRTRLCPITNQLLIAAVEWCLARGVKQMIIETNPIWLVQMVRLHFRPVPLGLMNTIAGEEVIACSLYFDQRTIQRLRQSPGWVVTHSSPKSGIA
jgi:acyl-homoserine lactone synthase